MLGLVAAAFLSAACPPPVAGFAPQSRPYDVRVFHLLQNFTKYPDFNGLPNKKVLIIGGDQDIVLSFRNEGFEAFRQTFDPKTPFDFIAFPPQIPIGNDVFAVVLFMLPSPGSPWETMKWLHEVLRILAPRGYIAFYHAKTNYFKHFLEVMHYARLPFRWYEMLIYQSPDNRPRGVYPIAEKRIAESA